MHAQAIHRCIHVLDLEKSVAFYRQALGLEVVDRMGPDDGSWENVFLGNEASGFQIELTWNRGRVEPYVNGGRDTHLAYAVDDMDAARALYDEMGCVCFVNERMGLYFIEDPDGCWIEVVPAKRSHAAQAGTDVTAAMARRRSVRTYTGECIDERTLKRVIEAGLSSATGRGKRPWELIVVRDRSRLEKLTESRKAGAGMLAKADAAIVVIGDPQTSDTWIEDCSIVMANMHLAADALGLGSCWIQGRGRDAADGRTTEEHVFATLDIPEEYRLEAILSLGVREGVAAPRDIDDVVRAKVHHELF